MPNHRFSLDRSRIRVVLLEGIHSRAADSFRAAGYTDVRALAETPQGNDLDALLADVHMLGIRSRTQLTRELLDRAPRLIAIGCFCIGTNQVDLRGAAARGVPVFNAPFSNTRSVAELVIAEAILLLRGVPAKHAALMQGVWRKSARNAFETRGKTLGVVGYGNIGAQLGVIAEAIGMKVVFFDIETKLKLGNARQLGSLNELLEVSDIVSLHVPATPDTRHLIDAGALEKMRSSAVLINASRGNVVDLEALTQALLEGRILGAAIDVYPEEPRSSDEPFVHALQNCENVILTPHIGGSTEEAQENIAQEVADKLIRYSDNGSTLSAVNFPEVSLPAHPGKHRLLHVHRNVPGVLSAINGVLSASGLNVAAQYLQTNADIGYVVIDLDAQHSRRALEGLRTIDGTLRTRVLF